MKKIITLIALVILTVVGNAQRYELSFQAEDEFSNIDSIIVCNLNQATSIVIAGSDILFLDMSTSLKASSAISHTIKNVHVYPNPAINSLTVNFRVNSNTKIQIMIYDLKGRVIVHSNSRIVSGTQTCKVHGLKRGLYTLSILGQSGEFLNKKIISVGNSAENLAIVFEGKSNNILHKSVRESGASNKSMPYEKGERIMFSAISGKNKSVLTDIPTEDKVLTFNFLECIDGDNNHYPTVKIGNQFWMAENLKTRSFNDGTLIDEVRQNSRWEWLKTPAYCWFNNDSIIYSNKYGALYNWNAAKSNKLCPPGWHVPTNTEWVELIDFLGGRDIAGGKLKEIGKKHWDISNWGSTDETGFSAISGGCRFPEGTFANMAKYAYWWCSNQYNTYNGWDISISNYETRIYNAYSSKESGYSIRCVKD